MKDFFYNTFGFSEQDYETTRQRLLQQARFQTVPAPYFSESCEITVDHQIWSAGTFSLPSLAELHSEVQLLLQDPVVQKNTLTSTPQRHTTIRNIIGEARALHRLPEMNGAVFQVASQFNLLEFPSPHDVTPEHGITGYMHDHTQGPACAMAGAAGTAYRNYLVHIMPSQQRGQTADCQINTLADMETDCNLWDTRNGYVESDAARLLQLNQWLLSQSSDLAAWTGKLRIGVQADTSVTDVSTRQQRVTQVYCAALSIGYSKLSRNDEWAPLARLILEATYEATLLVGIQQIVRAWKNNNIMTAVPILLTQLGGGVFGNDPVWIRSAIQHAVAKLEHMYQMPLDIRIVHFGTIDPSYLVLERL